MLVAWYRRYQGHNLVPLIFLASCYDGKPDDLFEEDPAFFIDIIAYRFRGCDETKDLINESSS